MKQWKKKNSSLKRPNVVNDLYGVRAPMWLAYSVSYLYAYQQKQSERERKGDGSHFGNQMNKASVLKRISKINDCERGKHEWNTNIPSNSNLSRTKSHKKNIIISRNTQLDSTIIFGACLCWLLRLKFWLCTHAINIPTEDEKEICLFLALSSSLLLHFDYIEILNGTN